MRRWWAHLPLRTKALAVLSIVLIPLMVSAVLAVATARREREAETRVLRALEIKSQISTTVSLSVDAEAAVSRYLLTREPESLEEFTRVGAVWPAALVRLRDLIADNPVLVKHGRAMAALQNERALVELLAYVRAHPDAPTPPAEMRAHSRSVMSRLRQELAAMQDAEDRLLAEGLAAARAEQTWLVVITTTGAALGLLGGVVAAIAFTSGITRRIDAIRRNAELLATGQPPETRPAGDDELGILSERLTELGLLLARRVQELDQFFTVSLELLCIADIEGRFRRVNPAFEAVLGWTAADLTAVPYTDFVHPDDVAATAAATAALARGEVVVNFENRYRCKDGSYKWLNWKAVVERSQSAIFAAARDVSEQKRTAHELRERVVELGVVNEELEAFGYSVSHDLRAPLRHVTGFASLLEQTAANKLDDEECRRLRTISEAASRMGRLIDDLLTFSRIGRTPITRQLVKLDDVVRDARRELEIDPVALRASWVVNPLPEVEGDPALLRLVFVNLIGNALKYSRDRATPRIEIGANGDRPGDAVIYVRDNGVGFEQEFAHKLFGVFQRLHAANQFEGTGIGLANVRRIVHRHGGRTWAEGDVNLGATFYISLPKAPQEGGQT